MVTLPDILASRARMAADLGPTPLVASHWLSAIAGGDIRLKLESLQVSHSFKARGALNAIRRLIERAEPGRLPSIVTASAGNHGRAIAWAAELTGLHATVFTPRTAPRSKLDAIVRHGAELRAIADHYEQAEGLARHFAAETGAVFVSPYNDDDVIAGAGTVGVEIVECWPEVDAVLVPVGGGGLISGIAVAVKAMRPEAELIGVEAEASCAFSAARAAGRLVTVDVTPTIADGLGGNVEADTRTWPYIRDIVDRIVIVSEDDLRTSIRGLLGEEHIVAEGAGIAAVAAVAARRVALDRRHAAVVISGANIDVGRLKECL